jgi:dihydrofolate synthase / folylpolyglutamate synthase
MNAHFKGRFDIVKHDNKTLIMDGAHNPQKMHAFISSLKKEFPNKQFDFLIAFKKGKDYKQMLDLIIPIAKSIAITSFFANNEKLKHLSEDTKVIENYLKNKIKVSIKENPKEALLSINSKEIVVTGSLYFLAEIYNIS